MSLSAFIFFHLIMFGSYVRCTVSCSFATRSVSCFLNPHSPGYFWPQVEVTLILAQVVAELMGRALSGCMFQVQVRGFKYLGNVFLDQMSGAVIILTNSL